jgi:hypothetical protein
MMESESSEQSETKNCKIIDGKFVVDMNQRMGGGSYSQVYASWPKGNPSYQLACKIISKVELDKQVLLLSIRFLRRRGMKLRN